MKTGKKIVLTVVHLFIAIITVILTVKGVLYGASDGQLGENMINWGYFKAFTVDSNDLAGIASGIVAVYLIINLWKKDSKLPYWVVLLQYISGVAVGLTFITTATFLAPTQVSIGNSYWLYFSGDMFFLHFLTPVLVICCFIVGNEEYSFKLKENLWGLTPLTLYAIFYVTNVIFRKTWSDFYGFTFGGHNSLVVPVLIVIFAVTFGIGYLMILCNKLTKRK